MTEKKPDVRIHPQRHDRNDGPGGRTWSYAPFRPFAASAAFETLKHNEINSAAFFHALALVAKAATWHEGVDGVHPRDAEETP